MNSSSQDITAKFALVANAIKSGLVLANSDMPVQVVELTRVLATLVETPPSAFFHSASIAMNASRRACFMKIWDIEPDMKKSLAHNIAIAFSAIAYPHYVAAIKDLKPVVTLEHVDIIELYRTSPNVVAAAGWLNMPVGPVPKFDAPEYGIPVFDTLTDEADWWATPPKDDGSEHGVEAEGDGYPIVTEFNDFFIEPAQTKQRKTFEVKSMTLQELEMTGFYPAPQVTAAVARTIVHHARLVDSSYEPKWNKAVYAVVSRLRDHMFGIELSNLNYECHLKNGVLDVAHTTATVIGWFYAAVHKIHVDDGFSDYFNGVYERHIKHVGRRVEVEIRGGKLIEREDSEEDAAQPNPAAGRYTPVAYGSRRGAPRRWGGGGK
jgi:hypothetical protein